MQPNHAKHSSLFVAEGLRAHTTRGPRRGNRCATDSTQNNERLFVVAGDGEVHPLDARWHRLWMIAPVLTTVVSHPLLRDSDNKLVEWEPVTDRAATLLPAVNCERAPSSVAPGAALARAR